MMLNQLFRGVEILKTQSERDLIEGYNACKQQLRRAFRTLIISKESDNKSNGNINTNNNILNTSDSIEFHWGSSCNKCKASPIQGIK